MVAGKLDNENYSLYDKEILFSYKEIFSEKWIAMIILLLIMVNQNLKDKCYVFALKCGFKLTICI